MSSPAQMVPSANLVQSLLHAAGIRGRPEAVSLLGASTSHVWAVTAGSERYVLRHRLDGDGLMARKEVYLGDLLRGHRVPAAEVLALVHDERRVATLSTFLPGIRLDRARASLAGHDLDSAWRSTGEALRRAHEIMLPVAGEIVGDQVEPFPNGWAQWVLEGIEDDIRWLQAALGAPTGNLSLLERVVASAMGALEGAPVQLTHNDALPQNVLVAPVAEGWRCTGWLDWEFARAADPRWDLGTLDFRPAGLVPPSFYEGYGAQPEEPFVSIYDLLTATWRTRAELEHGSHWEWPPQQARLAYLRRLPARIERLADLLGVTI